MSGSDVLDALLERGFVAQVSDEAGLRLALENGPLTLYCGFDVTATSLHVGHLVQIMMLAHMQRAGHRPIALVGGGTTMIGDPSGRTTTRPMLTPEEIETNAQSIKGQLSRYLDFGSGGAVLANNADWLMPLRYIEFLRDIGKHFTLNQLMQHETYRERYENDSLSFIELNYALVQAYDFLHLHQEMACELQIGGNDQWFNILAGVELTRRVADHLVFALTTPLLTTASGAKMGKTEAGAVWLDPSLVSPYDFYQYWRNTEDPDVGRFLRLFTFLPLGEIALLESLPGAEINRAKEVLAFEVTRITHGEAEALRARETAYARFRGEGQDLGPAVVVQEPTGLIDLMVAAGLADSRSDGKRLIKGGGVRLDGQPQPADREVALDELPALLSVGKRKVRVEASPLS